MTNIKEKIGIGISYFIEVDSKIKECKNDSVENYLLKVFDVNYKKLIFYNEFENKDVNNFGSLFSTRNISQPVELFTKYIFIIENKPTKQIFFQIIHLF